MLPYNMGQWYLAEIVKDSGIFVFCLFFVLTSLLFAHPASVTCLRVLLSTPYANNLNIVRVSLCLKTGKNSKSKAKMHEINDDKIKNEAYQSH